PRAGHPRRARELDEAEADQHHRPPADQLAGVEQAEVVEGHDQAEADDDQAEGQADGGVRAGPVHRAALLSSIMAEAGGAPTRTYGHGPPPPRPNRPNDGPHR